MKPDSLRYFLKRGDDIHAAVKNARKAANKKRQETPWEVIEYLGPGECKAKCKHCGKLIVIKRSTFKRKPCPTCREQNVALRKVGERVNGLTIVRAYKARENGRWFARYDVACSRCGTKKSGTLTRATTHGCRKCRYEGRIRRINLCGEQVTYHDMKKLFGISSWLILKKEKEGLSLEEIIERYAKPVEGRE